MANGSGTEATVRTAVPLGSTVALVVSKGPAPTQAPGATVPDVLGKPQADALEAVQQISLNARVFTQTSADYPRGKVMAQWPRAGEMAAAGSNAALIVSTGAPVEGTALTGVPRLIGKTEADALAELERTQLRGEALYEYSPTVPLGVVFAQLPEERTAAPKKGSKAWLWVGGIVTLLLIALAVALFAGGGGPEAEMVVVPGVVGLTQTEAEKALTAIGLEVGRITESPSTTATAGTVLEQDPARATKVEEGSEVDLVVATESDLVEVPNVVGMSRDAAQQLLAREQLQVSITEAPSDNVAAGLVISQSPKAGQQVTVDTQVGIVVSTGPAQKNVSVPNVVGLAEATAIQRLGEVGLDVETVDNKSETVPAGQVISQAPPAGASVAPGTLIVIVVSEGPDDSASETSEVPNVVGKSLAEATGILEDVGFEVVSFKVDGTGKPANQVVYQTPAAGATAPLGGQVALLVSSGS